MRETRIISLTHNTMPSQTLPFHLRQNGTTPYHAAPHFSKPCHAIAESSQVFSLHRPQNLSVVLQKTRNAPYSTQRNRIVLFLSCDCLYFLSGVRIALWERKIDTRHTLNKCNYAVFGIHSRYLLLMSSYFWKCSMICNVSNMQETNVLFCTWWFLFVVLWTLYLLNSL